MADTRIMYGFLTNIIDNFLRSGRMAYLVRITNFFRGLRMKRSIITIDEEKCDGCGLCITGCPEGALQMVDGKAKLVREDYCDGLGACIGECPRGAIHVEERESVPYDEYSVMENIAAKGDDAIRSHLLHLEEHGEEELLAEAERYLNEHEISVAREPRPSLSVMHQHGGGCPGSMTRTVPREPAISATVTVGEAEIQAQSRLRQWPVQLKLLNPSAPYFNNCHLLIAADCVPFASGNFHEKYLNGKVVAMFCPKLDSGLDEYVKKLTAVFSGNTVHSVTVLTMEVPCCMGTVKIAQEALKRSGKNIPLESVTVGINGEEI